MAQCKAKTNSGKRCKANATRFGYCIFHSDKYRKQALKKRGKARLGSSDPSSRTYQYRRRK